MYPVHQLRFCAYLSAGFLLLFAVDQAAATKLLMRDSWTVVEGVIAVSLAYVVGQLVPLALLRRRSSVLEERRRSSTPDPRGDDPTEAAAYSYTL